MSASLLLCGGKKRKSETDGKEEDRCANSSMAHLRMLTPETSPEPEIRPSGLWQSKPAITTTTTTATQLIQKRKRSWPFTTTRPVSPPSCSCPSGGERPSSSDTTSVKALWENGWRAAARKGAAPFQDARYEDLQPIFDALIEAGTDDAGSPEYTLAFYPRAHELALLAENALLHHGDAALAAELYLRACAVLRAARYSPRPPNSSSSSSLPTPVEAETSSPPHPACPVRARAWQLQKSYHLRAGRFFPDSPLDEVTIPHTHDAATRPDQNSAAASGVRDRGADKASAATRSAAARPQIPLAVRLPPRTLSTGASCPAVLVVTGDRTAHSALCADLLARGWGCVVVEAPGCGDCPVSLPSSSKEDDSAASAAASALWASVLEWMGAIRVFDMARVVVWADSGVDRPSALTGQFAAAVGGARVRGCVAVVGGGSSAVLASSGGWGSGGGRVLVVAQNDDKREGAGGACDGCRGGGVDGGDEGLVFFEYGIAGAEAAVRTLAAGAAAVYDWVEDVLGLDLVV